MENNENKENKITNETDEIFKKEEKVWKKVVAKVLNYAADNGEMFKKGEIAAGLGLAGYVLFKAIIKPRIDKKRRTQDEQIQILKQLLLESIENEK